MRNPYFQIKKKYNNAWNSKLDFETAMSIDFDRDVSTVQLVPKPDNCTPNHNNTTDEARYSQVYLTVLENNANETKINETSTMQQWTTVLRLTSQRSQK